MVSKTFHLVLSSIPELDDRLKYWSLIRPPTVILILRISIPSRVALTYWSEFAHLESDTDIIRMKKHCFILNIPIFFPIFYAESVKYAALCPHPPSFHPSVHPCCRIPLTDSWVPRNWQGSGAAPVVWLSPQHSLCATSAGLGVSRASSGSSVFLCWPNRTPFLRHATSQTLELIYLRQWFSTQGVTMLS